MSSGRKADGSSSDLSILDVIGAYVNENRILFAVYCSILIIYPLQTVVVPIFYGKIVSGIQNNTSLMYPLVGIIVLVVVIQLGSTVNDLVEVRMLPSLQTFIRTRIINRLFETNRTNLEELQVGEMLTKIIKLPSAMYALIDSWKMFYVPEIIVYFTVVVYFMVHDWKIGVALTAVLVTFLYSVWASVARCERLSWARDVKFNMMHEEVDDVLRNMVTVLSNNREDRELARINSHQEDFNVLSQRSLRCAIWLRLIFTPVIIIGLIAFMAYLYARMRAGLIKSSLFLTMFIIIMFVANSMWRIIYQMKDTVNRWGIIKESLYLLDSNGNSNVIDAADASDASAKGRAAIIVFDKVSFSYLTKAHRVVSVLRDLDLSIEARERTLIVGPIGSGKSTILKMIMMYKVPQSGVIYYDGTPLTEMSLRSLRSRVAYIPQLPVLLNRTLLENIQYGNDADEATVSAMIETLGLGPVFANFPDGLRTHAGKNGSAVSGGQRQIVCILRAMLQNPQVLLLDEPTASLDEVTKKIVNDILTSFMSGRTSVIVTHDEYLIGKSDRVIDLADAR